ncbi:HlyU family transcriptional regulator [Halomonas sp. V046]|uniref:HlyU family transcriptional regulator n=1 Tax=Halomonas sp. V046 TaxID=3459611 RepID=UPI004043F4DE
MLKKLFAGLFGADSERASKVAESEAVEHRGYLIISQPEEQGGQYRVSGVIRKPVAGGETLEHRFERSDMVPGRDACDALMRQKAERFIDEVGDDMFASR